MAFRTRDLFVRQRTQTINALRAHLAEHGIVVPSGPAHVGRLGALVQGDDGALPSPVVELARMLLQHIGTLTEQIAILEKDLRDRTRHDATAVRLMTIPGIGPICASAMTTFAPPVPIAILLYMSVEAPIDRWRQRRARAMGAPLTREERPAVAPVKS
jgi:transposase